MPRPQSVKEPPNRQNMTKNSLTQKLPFEGSWLLQGKRLRAENCLLCKIF